MFPHRWYTTIGAAEIQKLKDGLLPPRNVKAQGSVRNFINTGLIQSTMLQRSEQELPNPKKIRTACFRAFFPAPALLTNGLVASCLCLEIRLLM